MHSDASDSVNIEINPKNSDVMRLFLKTRGMELNVKQLSS
jgi:hypothetical protein